MRTKTTAALAVGLLALVPAAAYHIDSFPTGTGGLNPGDWQLAIGSVVITCESNGADDARNANPTSTPGVGGLCTTGEGDATGELPFGQGAPHDGLKAAAPPVGRWIELDTCSEITADRWVAGDARVTDDSELLMTDVPNWDGSPVSTAVTVMTADDGDADAESVDGFYDNAGTPTVVEVGDFRFHSTGLPVGVVAAGDSDVGLALVASTDVLRSDTDGLGVGADDRLVDDTDGSGTFTAKGVRVADDQCSGGSTATTTYDARVGAFQCTVWSPVTLPVAQVEQSLVYNALYAWWSYDGVLAYTAGDDSGPQSPLAASANNEDGYHGHVAIFLSSSAADHASPGTTSGSIVTNAITLPATGLSPCGASPIGGPVMVLS